MARDFSMIGAEPVEVVLPTGSRDAGGTARRRVWLEPLTGRDEEWLSNPGRVSSLPAWVSTVIGEKALYNGERLGSQRAAELSVADRDALILSLRMLTFGREIWGIARCPQAECRARLDFTFDLGAIETPVADGNGSFRTGWVDCRTERLVFDYREPNGSDQEVISGLVATFSPDLVWLTLLSRCLVRWGDRDTVSVDGLRQIPEEVLDEIDRIMAQGMTSYDWDIELTCTECGHTFLSALDIQDYFWEELLFCRADLWEEVHRLAFSYHWTESDILGLTRWKRKMYLNLINREAAAAGRI